MSINVRHTAFLKRIVDFIFLHEFDASAVSGWVSGTRWIALCTMLSGAAIGLFLWQQYATILAGFAERFALPAGAVQGGYLLAIGCGSMLLIAGGVGYWMVRPRHAASAPLEQQTPSHQRTQ